MLTALLLAAAATLPPLTQLDTGAKTLGNGAGVTNFTFYVAGDNRPDKGTGLSPAFVSLIKQMKGASPQPLFVIWGGDTVKGKKASEVKDEYATVRKEFGKLGVPVFNAPGNHELNLKGPSDDCHDAPDPSGELLAKYVKHMGPPYGMFLYGNSAFIAVDTDDTLAAGMSPACYNGFVGATQLAQLQATLTSLPSSVKNVFLFMHRPVYDDNDHQIGPIGSDKNTPYGQQLLAFIAAMQALKTPPVTYVFASHDHRYYAAPQQSGAPPFVITGGGGAPLSKHDGGDYHYLQVDVKDTSVQVTRIKLSGQ